MCLQGLACEPPGGGWLGPSPEIGQPGSEFNTIPGAGLIWA